MPVYIALLRGINVSGHKLIKMEALRKSFAAEGFKNVQTYIQSGNVVFESGSNSAPAIARKIEERILADYGFDVPVFVKSAEDLERAILGNPFVKEKEMDVLKLHVTFTSKKVPEASLEFLRTVAVKSERFHQIEDVIYLYLPEGAGNSKLANSLTEKKLGAVPTTRNWKTVNTLLEMARPAK